MKTAIVNLSDSESKGPRQKLEKHPIKILEESTLMNIEESFNLSDDEFDENINHYPIQKEKSRKQRKSENRNFSQKERKSEFTFKPRYYQKMKIPRA